MRDPISKLAEPAVILRPLPIGDGSPDATSYFGGLPRMPVDMAWPRSNFDGAQGSSEGWHLHFVGQINLASVPRDVQVGEATLKMPAFPASGTLYIFCGLVSDEPIPCVLYKPLSSGALVERQPPSDLDNLAEAFTDFVDRNGVDKRGLVLRRQALEFLPYLSTQAEHELVRNMDRAAGVNTTKRDILDELQTASLEAVLGREQYDIADLPFPNLPDMTDVMYARKDMTLLSRLAAIFQKTPQKSGLSGHVDHDDLAVWPDGFPWVWGVIRDIAQSVKKELTIDRDTLHSFVFHQVPELFHLWRGERDIAKDWINRCVDEDAPANNEDTKAFRHWLSHLYSAGQRVTVLSEPDPKVLEACEPLLTKLGENWQKNRPFEYIFDDGKSRYEKTAHFYTTMEIIDKMGCVAEHKPSHSNRYPQFICDFVDQRYLDKPNQLWCFVPAPYYDEWSAFYSPQQRIKHAIYDAIYQCAFRSWRASADSELPAIFSSFLNTAILTQTTLPPVRTDGHNFGDNSRVPIQMFGAGYLIQHAAVENADKVLLLQIGDGFGLPLNLHGGVLQVWIDPDDLAAGRFEKAFSTFECT